jgi:hypothetical protein
MHRGLASSEPSCRNGATATRHFDGGGPAGHGVWLKPDAIYEIPERERDSWFARYYPYTHVPR